MRRPPERAGGARRDEERPHPLMGLVRSDAGPGFDPSLPLHRPGRPSRPRAPGHRHLPPATPLLLRVKTECQTGAPDRGRSLSCARGKLGASAPPHPMAARLGESPALAVRSEANPSEKPDPLSITVITECDCGDGWRGLTPPSTQLPLVQSGQGAPTGAPSPLPSVECEHLRNVTGDLCDENSPNRHDSHRSHGRDRDRCPGHRVDRGDYQLVHQVHRPLGRHPRPGNPPIEAGGHLLALGGSLESPHGPGARLPAASAHRHQRVCPAGVFDPTLETRRLAGDDRRILETARSQGPCAARGALANRQERRRLDADRRSAALPGHALAQRGSAETRLRSPSGSSIAG